jgi:hypothetical protein
MMDPGQVATIEAHPLGTLLDAARASLIKSPKGPTSIQSAMKVNAKYN